MPHFVRWIACEHRGLYGLGDSLIVDPLLSGRMTHVPSGGDDCLIDFCYVENAAHAHLVAMDALLGVATYEAPATLAVAAERKNASAVGGRAFNSSSTSNPIVAPVKSSDGIGPIL